jgi:hypothetical protein
MFDDSIVTGPMWEGRTYAECSECLFEGDVNAWEHAGYMVWACPDCQEEFEQEFDSEFYIFGYTE